MNLTVLQWNVWFKENIDRVLGVVKPLNTDVVCLQELTHGYTEENKNSWEYIAQELGFFYHFQEIPVITADAQWLQGNAIFSRFPIENKQAVWIHEPAEKKNPNDQYRGYLEIKLNVEGTPVTIGTTHMSFGTDPDNDQELKNLLLQIKADKNNFILTGDINATPDSSRISELMKRLNHAGPPFDKNTWTTKPFNFHKFKASTLDWRYDYVFVSRDVKVLKAEIIETDVSDHLPIAATIELS